MTESLPKMSADSKRFKTKTFLVTGVIFVFDTLIRYDSAMLVCFTPRSAARKPLHFLLLSMIESPERSSPSRLCVHGTTL